ncbi:hypothetical protein DTO207G8_6553 [Paecilomyces variotii]|nr:hypothetical protein DTO207G8_6553 [Paecilomyces variotii]
MSSSPVLPLVLRFYAFFFCFNVALTAEVDITTGNDLMSFVTRPDIKAPRYEVTIHDPDSMTSGYWFSAPYSVIDPEAPTRKWMPCQVGPHIYDGNGTLIWSGACLFENRNVFDFRPVTNIDDEVHMSFILQHAYHDDSVKGSGMIYDQHYEHEKIVGVTNDLSAFNMHEFKVLEGGKTSLACTYRPENVDFADLGRPGETGVVIIGGFEEIDTATGKVVFEWSSKDHVSLSESTFAVPTDRLPGAPGWDYIHVNSVDKNANGDYLLSARFTNTIYLISGQDGHIIWRLGGKQSDFDQDFSFYRQHHAQFVPSKDNETVISFLNNASDEGSQEDTISTALIVRLDTTSMTARVVKSFDRPDGELTRLRGNVQILSNPGGKGDGNVFVGWSQQGYHSEFSPEGKLLMEARFISPRFSSYRTFKLPSNNFHGRPAEPPAIKSFVYASASSSTVTVFYVSWNGATDVASWNFYAQAQDSSNRVLVGNVQKTDFESMFMADGYLDWVSAEALDAHGNTLGWSEVQRSSLPENWSQSGLSLNPDDPSELASLEDYINDQIDADDDAEEEEEEEEDSSYGIFGGFGGFLIFLLLVACSVTGVAVDVWLGRTREEKLEQKRDAEADAAVAACERGQGYIQLPFDEEVYALSDMSRRNSTEST